MLGHILISTVFALLAGLLTLALRRNRAATRYWVWMAASIKFAVPFSLLTMLGAHVSWRTAPVIEAPAMAVSMAFEQTAAPMVAAPIRTQAHWDPIPLLVLVWAAGALAVPGHWLVRWRRMNAIARSASTLDLDSPIPVRMSEALIEPGIFGIFRPVLLLPAGITERLTPEQLRAIFLHEASHVRRRDNLTAFLHMLIEAAFWFHPLVWWIGARMVEERERACDEEVLRLTSEPATYAEGILEICRMYVESPLACVSGVTGANLRRRIEAIMNGHAIIPLTGAKRAVVAVCAIGALAAPIEIGVLQAPPLRAQTTPKFEVVSIKPCKPEDVTPGRRTVGGAAIPSPVRLTMACQTVADIMRDAYIPKRDPSAPRIVGGPDWIRSERYRIDATSEKAASQQAMNGPMLAGVLEERFRLKLRRENREVPVYFLTVAKSGAKLTPFRAGECTPAEFGTRPNPRPENLCKVMVGGSGTLDADGLSVGDLTKLLFLILDRPILDKTGLAGLFDFHFQFGRDESTPFYDVKGDGTEPTLTAPDDSTGPPIAAVLERQFGLKLERGKGTREFLVIDRIERPSEN